MASHTLTETARAAPPADDTAAHAVSAGFQLRYAGRLAAIILVGCAAAGGVLYLLLSSTLEGYAESLRSTAARIEDAHDPDSLRN